MHSSAFPRRRQIDQRLSHHLCENHSCVHTKPAPAKGNHGAYAHSEFAPAKGGHGACVHSKSLPPLGAVMVHMCVSQRALRQEPPLRA